jgi:RNA polymerase sigma factor (TIGR02999 family)
MGDVTRILNAITQGEPGKMDELLALVYGELRKLASHTMASQAAGQTLQPTALVHEAWLRLAADDKPKFQDRKHFFGSAAETMRQILIENARKKITQRRGGAGMRRLELDEVDVASPESGEQLLAIDEALEKLAAERPIEASVVKLRFFVGMTIEEAAEVLEISPRTVKNYWTYAKAWLYREMKAGRQ